MSFVIGVDGGGTKTTCVLADMGFVIGSATGDGSNFPRLGDAVAARNLEAVLSDLCFESGIAPSQIDAIYLGLAGSATPEVQSRVRSVVQPILLNAVVQVDTDVSIALESALGSAPGVIVISGTGSIAYGRNEQGETARAGGLGPEASDEGSGYWIGREVVKELLHSSSADPPLLGALLKHWNLASIEALKNRVNGTQRLNFAELFPTILQAGDKCATVKRVLDRAGVELGKLALEVIHNVVKSGTPIRVCIAGGVFASSAEVRRSFYQTLRETVPTAAVCFRISEPVQGAVQLARQLAIAKQAHR